MNALDRSRIVHHARDLVHLWNEYEKMACGDPWKHREARQAYYDALNSMKHCNLIEGFSLDSVTFPGNVIHRFQNGKWEVVNQTKSMEVEK